MSEVVKLNLWFSPQTQERVDLPSYPQPSSSALGSVQVWPRLNYMYVVAICRNLESGIVSGIPVFEEDSGVRAKRRQLNL